MVASPRATFPSAGASSPSICRAWRQSRSPSRVDESLQNRAPAKRQPRAGCHGHRTSIAIRIFSGLSLPAFERRSPSVSRVRAAIRLSGAPPWPSRRRCTLDRARKRALVDGRGVRPQAPIRTRTTADRIDSAPRSARSGVETDSVEYRRFPRRRPIVQPCGGRRDPTPAAPLDEPLRT